MHLVTSGNGFFSRFIGTLILSLSKDMWSEASSTETRSTAPGLLASVRSVLRTLR